MAPRAALATRSEWKGVNPVRVQWPSAIDQLFFAGDIAAHRLNLPGVHIQCHIDVEGQLDADRLAAAFQRLRRAYPVLDARANFTHFRGRPYWRLPDAAPSAGLVVHQLEQPTEHAFHAAIEKLFQRPIQYRRHAPYELHLFRGLPSGDRIVHRWAHALMDGRAGFYIVRRLNECFFDPTPVAQVQTRGDEHRQDIDQILRPLSHWRRARMLIDAQRRSVMVPGRPVHLVEDPLPANLGQMRIHIHKLSAAQTEQVFANCEAFGGRRRLSEFGRACGFRAVYDLLTRRPRRGLMTSMYLIDNRRLLDDPHAVCWNLPVSLPVAVTLEEARDIRTSMNAIRRQVTAHVRNKSILKLIASYACLAETPSAYLGAVLANAMRAGRKPTRGSGAGTVPSLPFDVVADPEDPLDSFCGRPISRLYGYATFMPHPGFSMHASFALGRLTVCVGYFANRIPPTMLKQLVDRMVTLMLDPFETDRRRVITTQRRSQMPIGAPS